MKNKITVTLLIVFIIIFSIVAFYFWYNYFLKFGSDGNLDGFNNKQNVVTIVDENKIYSIYEEGTEEPINVEGYKFRVENHSSENVRYSLIFTEIAPNLVNDGCSNKTILRPNELNYQLYYEDKVISQGNVAQINDNILDLRNIKGNDLHRYELKVWLNTSSSNNDGKHYHYKVELKVIE